MHQYVQHKQFTSHSYLKKETRNQNSNINHKYTEQINHPNFFFPTFKNKTLPAEGSQVEHPLRFHPANIRLPEQMTSLFTGWISGWFSPVDPFRESPSILDGVFLKSQSESQTYKLCKSS